MGFMKGASEREEVKRNNGPIQLFISFWEGIFLALVACLFVWCVCDDALHRASSLHCVDYLSPARSLIQLFASLSVCFVSLRAIFPWHCAASKMRTQIFNNSGEQRKIERTNVHTTETTKPKIKKKTDRKTETNREQSKRILEIWVLRFVMSLRM